MNSDELIKVYSDRFINRVDIWGKQYPTPDGGYSYACQKPDLDTRFKYEPVSPDLIRRHLCGEITCAWAATSSTGESKWLCFDSDKADGELDKLEAFLRKWKWRVIREGRRSGRDGHLWLLFDQPVPSQKLMLLGDVMMTKAGIATMERFPKGDPLKPPGYSQVRGPLGVHLKPEANRCRGWFDGPTQDTNEQLIWLAQQPLNKATDAIREANTHAIKRPTVIPGKKKTSGRVYRTDIRKHVTTRLSRNQLVAQCPLCAAEGHDAHEDNLHITPDGTRFCCVYGGPAQVHKNPDILKALTLPNRQRNAS